MYSPQTCSDSDSLTDAEETTPLILASVEGMNQSIHKKLAVLIPWGLRVWGWGLAGVNFDVCTIHVTGPL